MCLVRRPRRRLEASLALVADCGGAHSEVIHMPAAVIGKMRPDTNRIYQPFGIASKPCEEQFRGSLSLVLAPRVDPRLRLPYTFTWDFLSPPHWPQLFPASFENARVVSGIRVFRETPRGKPRKKRPKKTETPRAESGVSVPQGPGIPERERKGRTRDGGSNLPERTRAGNSGRRSNQTNRESRQGSGARRSYPRLPSRQSSSRADQKAFRRRHQGRSSANPRPRARRKSRRRRKAHARFPAPGGQARIQRRPAGEIPRLV